MHGEIIKIKKRNTLYIFYILTYHILKREVCTDFMLYILRGFV